MKVIDHSRENAIRLEFPALADVETFFTQAKEQTGFYLQLAEPLALYQKLAFTAVAPPRFEFAFEAEVIQVFPGPDVCGIAFQLCWQPGQAEQLHRQLGGRDESADPSQNSPIFKIRNMNPNERFRLATRASRIERQILLRDPSPHVLLGLLSHPQLEPKEVLEIVRSNYATGAIMERVAQNRKWMAHPEMPAAIVKSPKTPTPLAVTLLNFLRISDLRVLAKSGSVREALRKEALKVYLKRSGRRG